MKDLRPLLHARSVCLVGASGDAGRVAGQPLQLLLKHGFAGRIVCVNPKYDEIAGQPCHPSIADLPEPVDAALITLPAAAVPDAVRACGRRGIRHVVVLSAGFEETTEGRERARALADAAAEHDVVVVGPNSEGIWSPGARLLLTHGTAASRERVLDGPVSVLSQSGSIGAGIVRQLQDDGIGCRYFISLGNETVLSLTDCLSWMVDEGGSRVVLLFVEGLRDGAALVDAARKALALGMSVVALKAGASQAGRAATASHTGKMATSARVYSSIFRQAGMVEVHTLGELVEAGTALSMPAPRTGGKRLAVLSASGGCRALIADAAEREGLAVPAFDDATQGRIAQILDGQGVAANPVDVPMTALYDPQRFAQLLRTVTDDSATDSVIVQYANRGLRQIEEHVQLLADARGHSGKPVAVSFLGDLAPAHVRARLRDAGVLCAREPAQAVRQLAWCEQRGAAASWPPRRVPPPRRNDTPTSAAAAAAASWNEQVALLERCAIPMPRWRAAPVDAAAAAAAGNLRFPLAAKAFPQDADHKAEAGLVITGVADEAALAAALHQLRARLGPGRRVLLQEMVAGGAEALLAARIDPDFGPVLAVGSGGAAVELLEDVAWLSLPVDPDEVGRALDRLLLARAMQPWRGRAALDRAAFVQAACRLGDVFVEQGLCELEINPLIVLPQGRGVIAVDVLTR